MANLQDPKNMFDKLAPTKVEELNNKIGAVKLQLSMKVENGGMPFVYAFTASKPHEVNDIKIPYINEQGKEEFFYTAATNGKRYFWSPEMIDRLTAAELMIVMAHETYHICLQHCIPERTEGRNPKCWNVAVDYVVNSTIEWDMIKSRKVSESQSADCKKGGKEHPIWKGGLGRPLYLMELLHSIEGKAKKISDLLDKNPDLLKIKVKDERGNEHSTTVDRNSDYLSESEAAELAKEIAKVAPEKRELYFFADYEVHGRSAESIYDEIMKKIKNEAKKNNIPYQMLAAAALGGSADVHMPSEVNRAKLIEDMQRAALEARKMSQYSKDAGVLPDFVEDMLAKLSEPKLKWQDIVKHTIQTKRQESGSRNDYTRFRRRFIAMDEPMFLPKKRDDFVNWICLLDTSGSMSAEDIAFGVSQLKCLDHRSEGIVVPCDAAAHWSQATKILSVKDDLMKIKPVGRGGTVFADFFANYQKKFNMEFDVVIVITDGYLYGDEHTYKRPKSDTIWVITSDLDNFKAPFGRVAHLRGDY